mgnify:CR=1 FL=1
MSKQNSTVAIFDDHTGAEHAVKELQKAGFDIKKLSLVGKDYHSDEQVVGYYNTGDRMRYWGKLGAFWGGLWGLLFGSALSFFPGIGPIVVGGPIVMWIVGALEGAVVLGGISAIGAALYSIGIPKDSVLKYETSLKANKFLLVVHGDLPPDNVPVQIHAMDNVATGPFQGLGQKGGCPPYRLLSRSVRRFQSV